MLADGCRAVDVDLSIADIAILQTVQNVVDYFSVKGVIAGDGHETDTGDGTLVDSRTRVLQLREQGIFDLRVVETHHMAKAKQQIGEYLQAFQLQGNIALRNGIDHSTGNLLANGGDQVIRMDGNLQDYSFQSNA